MVYDPTPIPKNEKCCQNCAAFAPDGIPSTCHLNPPTIIYGIGDYGEARYFTIWPEVQGRDWCRKFFPASPSSKNAEVPIEKYEMTLPPSPAKIPLTPAAIKNYLDGCIRHWRKQRIKPEVAKMAAYYVDAFQSVRTSLFDELLPTEEEEK